MPTLPPEPTTAPSDLDSDLIKQIVAGGQSSQQTSAPPSLARQLYLVLLVCEVFGWKAAQALIEQIRSDLKFNELPAEDCAAKADVIVPFKRKG